MLDWQIFVSDIEVQSEIRQWLGQQPASLFALGTQKIVDRLNKYSKELDDMLNKKYFRL